MKESRLMEILLIEDNQGDIELTKEAFLESGIANNLNVAENGEDAIKYLKREGKYLERTLPNLVLLDLNLPKMHGLEILSFIKNDYRLNLIPVIIFSSSSSNKDISDSYRKHANSYVTKPFNYRDYTFAINSIIEFWLKYSSLPQT